MTRSIFEDAACGVGHDGTPQIGAPEHYDGEAVVGYLRIVGFVNAVLNDWSASDNHPVDRLLGIRDSVMDDGVKIGWFNYGPRGELKKSPGIVTRRHILFDSVVVSVALGRNSDARNVGLSILAMAFQLGALQKAATEYGLAISGGVEVGDVHWSAGEIVGPALIDAIRIQTKFTNGIRCLVGPRALRSLQRAMEYPGYPYWKRLIATFEDGLIGIRPQYMGSVLGPNDPLTGLRMRSPKMVADIQSNDDGEERSNSSAQDATLGATVAKSIQQIEYLCRLAFG